MTIDDLPTSDLQWLAREAGLPVALALWRRCAGTTMGFPSRVTKDFALRYIAEHWDASQSAASVRELARALSLSERTIYDYLDERSRAAVRREPSPQLALI